MDCLTLAELELPAGHAHDLVLLADQVHHHSLL